MPIKIDLDIALQANRMQARSNIQQAGTKARARLVQADDPAQFVSWSDKTRRAERVLAGNANDADYVILAAETTARGKGESVEQLAAKQVAKAAALAERSATLDGFEKAILERINTAEDVETLEKLQQEFCAQLSTLEQQNGSAKVQNAVDWRAAQAHQRIIALYPEWKQVNILRGGDKAEIACMGAFIDACRAWVDDMDASTEMLRMLQPAEVIEHRGLLDRLRKS